MQICAPFAFSVHGAGAVGRPTLRSLARIAAAAALLVPLIAESVTVRYASSNNRLYLEGGGSITLSGIKEAYPKAPLDLVDPVSKIWLLRANLMLKDGSALILHGGAIGGDVNELRLKSDNVTDGFIWISADYGRLDIQSTRITSWNSGANGPDTEYSTYGRAYIRVRSRLASDGVTPLESRMDIVDSDIGHLGFNASEAYGLVWKVIGKAPGLYDKVQVWGNIINSRIHHNYFGIYTYGHQDGLWRDNEVDHNVKYGFDPHDDSDNIVIENNDVHHNGNHGIIASQRCDHVVIRGNRSWANTGNGIMLHRSSNDALVEENEAYDNTDSGIAIFASSRIEVRNNVLTRNGKSGMRLSLGAADNLIEDNQFIDNHRYGLYFYKGSDTPNSGDDGRPKRNIFRSNIIRGSGSEGIKMSDADRNRFEGNQFEDNLPKFSFYRAQENELIGNALPNDLSIYAKGTSTLPTVLQFVNQPRIKISMDSYSRGRFIDPDRSAFDPDESIYTVVERHRSSLAVNSTNTGGTTTVLQRRLYALPSSSHVSVNPTRWNTSGDYSKAWKAKTSATDISVSYVVGDLLPGTSYTVTQGSRKIGQFIADVAGRISFSDAPGTTSILTYDVAPSAITTSSTSKGQRRGWYKKEGAAQD